MTKTKTNFASYCFKEISYNTKVRVSTVLETPGTNKLKIFNLGGTDSKYMYTIIHCTMFCSFKCSISASKIYWMASLMLAFMLTAFFISDSFLLIVTLILRFHLIFILETSKFSSSTKSVKSLGNYQYIIS